MQHRCTLVGTPKRSAKRNWLRKTPKLGQLGIFEAGRGIKLGRTGELQNYEANTRMDRSGARTNVRFPPNSSMHRGQIAGLPRLDSTQTWISQRELPTDSPHRWVRRGRNLQVASDHVPRNQLTERLPDSVLDSRQRLVQATALSRRAAFSRQCGSALDSSAIGQSVAAHCAVWHEVGARTVRS